MESYALPIFRAGHIPVPGEWLALPRAELAGSRKIGDEAFDEIFPPLAIRLLENCEGGLRVGALGGRDEVSVSDAASAQDLHAPAEIPRPQ